MKDKCVWTYYENEFVYYWDASCGDSFTFETGTPQENNFTYCPFCGKKIKTVEPEEDESDD